jgi:hypothetical protein
MRKRSHKEVYHAETQVPLHDVTVCVCPCCLRPYTDISMYHHSEIILYGLNDCDRTYVWLSTNSASAHTANNSMRYSMTVLVTK